MTQVRKHLQGGCPVQTFSWSGVQPPGNGIQLALRVGREVRALGQILAEQAIGIFIGPPLPRAMRIGKEHLDGQPLGQLLMFRHLFPSIIGQRFPQRGGDVSELLGKSVARTLRLRPLKPSQDNQARGPLDQGPDGRGIAGSLDQVAFPVTWDGASRDFGGALGKEGHVGDLPSSIRSSRPGPARFARLTQCGQQFAAQGAAGQHVQLRVYGLSREAFLHVGRILPSEATGNLFGRIPLGQSCSDIAPQPGIQPFSRPPGQASPACREGMGCTSSIRSARCRVAGLFPTQCARRPPQDRGHRAQRMALGQPQAQGLPFFETQVRIGVLVHGNTLANQGQKCCTWS